MGEGTWAHVICDTETHEPALLDATTLEEMEDVLGQGRCVLQLYISPGPTEGLDEDRSEIREVPPGTREPWETSIADRKRAEEPIEKKRRRVKALLERRSRNADSTPTEGSDEAS